MHQEDRPPVLPQNGAPKGSFPHQDYRGFEANGGDSKGFRNRSNNKHGPLDLWHMPILSRAPKVSWRL